MLKHIRRLEEIEKPYYTPAGTLREDVLRNDFEDQYGKLRDRLSQAVRHEPATLAYQV